MEFKNIIKEHIQWRSQIFKLAEADLKKTYNGAALGWAWAIIKPTITIFIYWFAFSMGFREKAGIADYPFFLWLVAGIISWFYIQEMWIGGPSSMRTYRFLITKMKFPTSTIPTFYSLSRMVTHLFLLVIVFIIYLFAGYGVSIYYIQIPFYMLCMYLLMTGWCLFAGVVGAMSRDFSNLVKSFSMALFWLSGIMIPISNIKNDIAQAFFMLNPVTYIVEGYRNCFVHHKWFFEEPVLMAIFFVEVVVMWAMAVATFSKLKKEMPDVL
ncbi:MAG: ABC transporter permease [Eubacterium sp.]|nr:ABC transporter permease [Eubacterium sp.]